MRATSARIRKGAWQETQSVRSSVDGSKAARRERGQMLELRPGHHGEDTGSAARGLDVQRDNARVGVRGAEEGHVGAGRGAHIVHVTPRADEEAVILASLERPAYPGAVRGSLAG